MTFTFLDVIPNSALKPWKKVQLKQLIRHKATVIKVWKNESTKFRTVSKWKKYLVSKKWKIYIWVFYIKMFFVLLCCCLAALCQGVLGGNELRIKNASELIELSKNVNYGTSYSGKTVFLCADIDFSGGLSEQFEPIGTSNSFQGTFDGQGYTISNLAINSSFEYVGLFGFSNDATIKNVVLDDSCSVVNSFIGNANIRVAGIVGVCYAYYMNNGGFLRHPLSYRIFRQLPAKSAVIWFSFQLRKFLILFN